MSVEQVRGDDGKFVSPVTITQDDAKKLDISDSVDKDEGDDAGEAGKEHPRVEMMKAARERRAKEHGLTVEGDAFKAGKPDSSPADFKDAKKPEGTEEEEKPEPEKRVTDKPDDAPQAHVATLADTDIVEIKVNGEVVKLPWGEAQKKLQLASATEEALAEAKAEKLAARAARKLAEEERAAERPVVQVQQEQPKPAVDHFALAKTAKDAAFDVWENAVRYGSEEEIAAAKRDLRAKEDQLDTAREDRYKAMVPQQQPQADPLMQKEVFDTDRATKDYAKEFSEDQKDRLFRAAMSMSMRDELISDLRDLAPLTDREDVGNILSKLSDQELGVHHQRARSRGLVRTLDKVLTTAGTKARDELKSRSAPVPGKPDPAAQRQLAKENAPSIPRSATGRTPEPEEAKPKTSQDIMAEVRKHRGK